MFYIYLYVFSLGLMSILSACAIIMFPIIVSKYDQDFKNFLFFFFGVFIVYIGLGAIAAITGNLLSNFIGDYLFVFAGIVTFIAALHYLGLFNLHIPIIMFNKNPSNNMISGITYGFVSLSCSGLALSAALGIIISVQKIMQGILLISLYALGFILPYILLGKIITNNKIHAFILKHSKLFRNVSGVFLLIASAYLLFFGLRGFFN